MEENFDNIVRKYYSRLKEPFLRRLTRKYPEMRLAQAEDLYQEAFLAVQDNIKREKVRPDTNWNAYILTIGMNMASKEQREGGRTTPFGSGIPDDEEDGGNRLLRKVEDIIKDMPEEEVALCKNEEVLSCLADELQHSPGLCEKIIRLYYYGGASTAEIAEETGLKNSRTVISTKNRCMNDLTKRITKALRNAGFDLTPKRRNRNGRN